ncbi:MAG TPA: hypothetical protein VG738_16510 [Chitinophagaceae bacterium]|nr:hypothetical protein [Chitinophagaceae bacterium]
MGNLGFQELLLVVIIFYGICLLPVIFYLITLQKALQTVSRENRKLEPGLVWLLLIPVFNAIWMFFVADGIGTGFQREFEKYGMATSEKPTYNLGLTLAILWCCCIIPVLNIFAGLGGFVIWIIYWIKVNEVKNELVNISNNMKLGPNETSIFV